MKKVFSNEKFCRRFFLQENNFEKSKSCRKFFGGEENVGIESRGNKLNGKNA